MLRLVITRDGKTVAPNELKAGAGSNVLATTLDPHRSWTLSWLGEPWLPLASYGYVLPELGTHTVRSRYSPDQGPLESFRDQLELTMIRIGSAQAAALVATGLTLTACAVRDQNALPSEPAGDGTGEAVTRFIVDAEILHVPDPIPSPPDSTADSTTAVSHSAAGP
jgi:hypothetical protein